MAYFISVGFLLTFVAGYTAGWYARGWCDRYKVEHDMPPEDVWGNIGGYH